MREEKEFNDYYEVFKELPLENKIKIVNEEYKEMLKYITKINKTLNLDDKILINKEMFDIEISKDNINDFVNSSFIYIHSIEESIGTYMEMIFKILYKEKEE